MLILRRWLRGSSPLARGPRRSEEGAEGLAGLIPARAGTTVHGCSPSEEGRAHPRSRGDHEAPLTTETVRQGSSPLARGPLVEVEQFYAGVGLIPARAGTTKISVMFITCNGAHPRSRGDHHLLRRLRSGLRGSSPLARGPLITSILPTGTLGLIPARAGTTCCGERRRFRSWAHPRSRGDHARTEPPLHQPAGSSPLARGPHSPTHQGVIMNGLIPARAGTTGRAWPLFLLRWAHPRSRGDHIADIETYYGKSGSSPLARGPPSLLNRL